MRAFILGAALYIVAIALISFIVARVIKKKFNTSDATTLLGAVMALIAALNISPPPAQTIIVPLGSPSPTPIFYKDPIVGDWQFLQFKDKQSFTNSIRHIEILNLYSDGGYYSTRAASFGEYSTPYSNDSGKYTIINEKTIELYSKNGVEQQIQFVISKDNKELEVTYSGDPTIILVARPK